MNGTRIIKSPQGGISNNMVRLNESIFENHVKNSAFFEAKRLENIKFDTNNEALIIAKKFLNVQNSIIVNNLLLKAGRDNIIKESTARLAVILENEGKILSKDFGASLLEIFTEANSTYSSTAEIKGKIIALFDISIQSKK